jgi:hypothetical protein
MIGGRVQTEAGGGMLLDASGCAPYPCVPDALAATEPASSAQLAAAAGDLTCSSPALLWYLQPWL